MHLHSLSPSVTNWLLTRTGVQIEVGDTDTAQGKKRIATARMIFKPTLLDRLSGMKDVIITSPLDASKLFDH